MKNNKTASADVIALNKKARHDYFIEKTYQAGIVLQGWEVKSLRAKSIQLKESYILLKAGEAWLFGAHVSPLPTASTHIKPDPLRSRKLLLQRNEIDSLIGAVERKGYTLVPLKLYWQKGRAKAEIGIARGKQQHRKRKRLAAPKSPLNQSRLMKF